MFAFFLQRPAQGVCVCGGGVGSSGFLPLPAQVAEKLEMLKKEYEDKLAQKEELRKKSEEMEIKLDRADKLVSGLAGEKIRWEENVKARPEPGAGPLGLTQ